MNNKGPIKALIIILAVVCIGLTFLYAHTVLSNSKDPSEDHSDDVANYDAGYDPSYQGSSFGGITIVSGSDGIYTITDDSTTEMDSIPNEQPENTVSASDAP